MTDLPFTGDDIYEIHKELYRLAYSECSGANGWFATLYPDGEVGYSQYCGVVPISSAAWNGDWPHDVTMSMPWFSDLADANWRYDEDEDCYYYDGLFGPDEPYTVDAMLEEDYGWWMDSCGGQEQVDEIVAELLIEMRSAFFGEISEEELAAERQWEEECRRMQAV